MITFNEAKQMLDQGIFPCLNGNGALNYIIGYSENNLVCYTLSNVPLHADSMNEELYFAPVIRP